MRDAARRGLAQTVGHGLLVRLDTFQSVGGLPEDTLLDDLPFGYRLTAAGVPVDCVPALATAEAPHDLGDLITQGSRWFHSYLDYPKVAHAAALAGDGTSPEHAIGLGVAAYRGLCWLFASPVIAAATVALVAPRTRPAVRLLAAAGLWTATVTPVRQLATANQRQTGAPGIAAETASLYAAHLLNSVGPIACLATKLLGSNRGVDAPKTVNRINRGHQ
ncbi:MAG TPA: glycosyltransferase family 2 protein [Candidatus Limnocylindrales bacterium]|nr:glycosyltransferase family 2 protein [Candidatus Limnocylindrales bacterium]